MTPFRQKRRSDDDDDVDEVDKGSHNIIDVKVLWKTLQSVDLIHSTVRIYDL
jgi:hypothetical protein